MIVFIDMDGVLVDFVSGYLKLCEQRSLQVPEITPGKWFNIPDEHFPHMGDGFWASLNWMPLGQSVMKACDAIWGFDNLYLCTAPAASQGCLDGKQAWVDHFLPSMSDRVIYTKYKHLLAGPDRLLVDDREKTCQAFAKAGGVSYLMPSPINHRCDEEFDVETLYRQLIEVTEVIW